MIFLREAKWLAKFNTSRAARVAGYCDVRITREGTHLQIIRLRRRSWGHAFSNHPAAATFGSLGRVPSVELGYALRESPSAWGRLGIFFSFVLFVWHGECQILLTSGPEKKRITTITRITRIIWIITIDIIVVKNNHPTQQNHNRNIKT